MNVASGHDGPLFVGEATTRELVSLDDAIVCIERALGSVDDGRSASFPALRAHGRDPSTRFGVKAGFSDLRGPGVKLGTYWPANPRRGLAAHGSTTLLLDGTSGQLRAIVMATHLNALRTAAADAVAVKHLARADSTRLALLGTGNQAYFEAIAASKVRAIGSVAVWGRDERAAHRLSERLGAAGLNAAPAGLDRALAEADIVITATAARAPLFDDGAIRPGTHVSAMGADGPGKQELPVDLLRRATLFADWPAQSREMGEFQHLNAVDPPKAAVIRPMAEVIRAGGYERADGEVTIFDSSGIALQDIEIASLALERAVAAGAAVALPHDRASA